jgi:heptosyltransferase-1
MGDLVQTLPAITDAKRARPEITFDWVVDESFADVPRMHSAVERVIPTAFKRYGRGWRKAFASGEIPAFLRELRGAKYDLIVDVQGEFKSALAALLAKGSRAGYVGRDVHEWGAHLTYARRYRAAKGQHSLVRMRQLLASVLDYEYDDSIIDYGIDHSSLPEIEIGIPTPYLVFVHSTSWTAKNWPLDHWRRLIRLARDAGYTIVIPWGSEAEREKSLDLAGGDSGVVVLPPMSIAQKASIISRAKGTVGLDTGLSHISAALGVPSVTVYGATDPALVGALGANQVHLVPEFRCLYCHQKTCRLDGIERAEPACLDTITGEAVWQELSKLLASAA